MIRIRPLWSSLRSSARPASATRPPLTRRSSSTASTRRTDSSHSTATRRPPSAGIAFTGLPAGEQIVGLDVRPANKQVVALSTASRLYRIDVATGAATAIGAAALTPALSGASFGFDFNPTVDRIRATSDVRQNLRLHPDTGATAFVDGTLTYAAGDAGASATPRIVGSAYTNSVAGATTTTLFDIDAGTGLPHDPESAEQRHPRQRRRSRCRCRGQRGLRHLGRRRCRVRGPAGHAERLLRPVSDRPDLGSRHARRPDRRGHRPSRSRGRRHRARGHDGSDAGSRRHVSRRRSARCSGAGWRFARRARRAARSPLESCEGTRRSAEPRP